MNIEIVMRCHCQRINWQDQNYFLPPPLHPTPTRQPQHLISSHLFHSICVHIEHTDSLIRKSHTRISYFLLKNFVFNENINWPIHKLYRCSVQYHVRNADEPDERNEGRIWMLRSKCAVKACMQIQPKQSERWGERER